MANEGAGFSPVYAFQEGFENGKLVGKIDKDDGTPKQIPSRSEWLNALPDEFADEKETEDAFVRGCEVGYAAAGK